METVIPECTVRLESGSDAKSKLTCDVISSPAVLNYTWIRGNKSLSEDAMKLLSLNSSSISIVLPDNDPAEAYSCIVSNSVGTSKACRLQSHEFTGKFTGKSLMLSCDVENEIESHGDHDSRLESLCLTTLSCSHDC